MVYAISPDDRFEFVPKLPRDADRLRGEGWLFLSSRRCWDSDSRERISQATGLYAISPTYAEHASQGWWKTYLRSYLVHFDPAAAIMAIGEPVEDGRIGPLGTAAEEPADLEWGASSPPWRIEVQTADLLPFVNAHYLLRMVGGADQHATAYFIRFTLVGTQGRLWVRHLSGAFDVPVTGSWPSPIAVNCKAFIKTAQDVAEDRITLMYQCGRLHINDAVLQAQEL